MAIGIRKKVIFISVAVLFMALAATTTVSSFFFMREYSAALKSRALLVGSILKYQLEKLLKYDIPLNELVGFDEQCQEIINNYGDITYAMVVDLHGRILFHNDPQKRGEMFIYKNIQEILQNQKEELQRYNRNGEKFYNFSIPVQGLDNAPIAAVIIGFPASLITHKTALMVAYSVGVAIIFLIMGGISMVILLQFWVTTPLGQLLVAIMDIRSGGTDSAQLPIIKSKDEFGDLGRAFNEMVLQLKESQARVQNYTQELEFKVAESTSHLKEANEKLRQDIQVRLQAEAALRESEEKYRLVFEKAPLGIMHYDQTGTITDCNEKFTEIIGAPKEKFIGFNMTRQLRDEKMREAVAASLKGEVGYYEGDYLSATAGKLTPVRAIYQPIFSSDGVLSGGVTIFEDITEHKKAEEERLRFSKLESLGTLTGGIAHDFNNLIAVIMGNIEMAQMDNKLGERTQKRLEQAEKGCHRARDLTNKLLTFAKGGAPVKKPMFIGQLISEFAQFALTGSNVKCEIDILKHLWPVEVDEAQITQVMHNIVINAQQAMPDGGKIQISAENIILEDDSELPLNSGKYVRVALADQGEGIPPENLRRIFDPYFSTKGKGSGLGLAAAYSIIQGHGGYLTVASKIGAGSTFIFYLPASDKTVQPQEEPAEELVPAQGRILVMEDEEMLIDFLQQMLSEIGYEVECARDGHEAIALYEEAKRSGKTFAAVIMDLTIPGGMGGKEAIKFLLELDPHCKAIVSSGYSDDPIMAKFEKYGFSGVIVKPYKISELGKILNQVIMKKA